MPFPSLLLCLLLFINVIIGHEHDTHPLLSKLTSFDLLHDLTHLDEVIEIVHERKLRANRRGNVRYNVTAFDKVYELDLEPHRVTEGAIPHYTMSESGDSLLDVEHIDLDCMYKGSLADKENSYALFSFCHNEVRGRIIHEKNSEDAAEDLHFQPVPDMQSRSGRKLTVAYRVKDIVPDPWHCAIDEEEDNQKIELDSKRIASLTKRDSMRASMSYVEIFIVNDKARCDAYTVGIFAHSLYLFSLVNDLYSGFLGNDKITLRVTGVLSLTRGDPWSAETRNNGQSVVVDEPDGDGASVGLLNLFGEWINSVSGSLHSATTSASPSIDAAHLISGHDFITYAGSTSVVGLARRPGVCFSLNNAVGTTQDLFIDSNTATVMTHEIGHNLGFAHTTQVDPVNGPTTACQNQFTPYIMDPSGTSARTWSQCSLTWWQNTLSEPNTFDCFDLEAEDPLNAANCGNGVVDRDSDEECDCGLKDCSLLGDNCCDGNTCKYKSSAVCAGNDLCCNLNTCEFASMANEVCRATKDSSGCDATEFCTGASKTCPDDSMATFGSSCSINSFSGRCFRGRCVSPGEQCSVAGYNDFCVIQGDGDAVCAGEDQTGILCRGSNSNCAATSFPRVVPSDGTECASGMGCYKEHCVSYSEIPTVDECINFEVDEGETDVDCGGDVCLPCSAGKNCLADRDCFGTCNTTSGTCLGVEGGDGEDIFDIIKRWLEDNKTLAIVIAGALVLILLYSVSGSIYTAIFGKAKRIPLNERQSLHIRNSRNRASARLSAGVASNNNNNRNSNARSSARLSANGPLQPVEAFQYAIPVPEAEIGSRASQRLSRQVVRNSQRMSRQVQQLPLVPGLEAPPSPVAARGSNRYSRNILSELQEGGSAPAKRQPQFYVDDIEDKL